MAAPKKVDSIGIPGRIQLSFIEHHGDIPRHADLIGLGVVGFGSRFLGFVARGIALLNQPLLNPFQLGGMVSAIPLPFLARLRELSFQRLDMISK